MHLLGVYKRERERESFYVKIYSGGITDIKIRSDAP